MTRVGVDFIHALCGGVLSYRLCAEIVAMFTWLTTASVLTAIYRNKRQFDGGYGSRYVAAHSVGSKLMGQSSAQSLNALNYLVVVPGRVRFGRREGKGSCLLYTSPSPRD